MPRYALKPVLDAKKGQWRLNLPARISPTGKRQRVWFASHALALGAAKRIRLHQDQFGYSSRMLPGGRLNEAIEVYELLDQAAGQPIPPGRLRAIIKREIKAETAKTKSVTLDQLWESYLEQLQQRGTSEKYLESIGHVRRKFKYLAEDLLPEITPSLLGVVLDDMPPGNRNHFRAILRAAFNLALERRWLKENPVIQLKPVAGRRLKP